METKKSIEATCPDCRGPLSEIEYDGELVEYRCLVGHAYSPRSLLEAHSDVEERALWAAVVALEEAANLARCLAERIPEHAGYLEEQATKKMEQAAAIRRVLEELEPFQTDWMTKGAE